MLFDFVEKIWIGRPPAASGREEANVPQHDGVLAGPDLVGPAAICAQLAAPCQLLSNLWVVEHGRGLHVDHQEPAVGFQQEVGHVAPQSRSVSSRHPEGLPSYPPHLRIEVGQPQPIPLQEAFVADQGGGRC